MPNVAWKSDPLHPLLLLQKLWNLQWKHQLNKPNQFYAFT